MASITDLYPESPTPDTLEGFWSDRVALVTCPETLQRRELPQWRRMGLRVDRIVYAALDGTQVHASWVRPRRPRAAVLLVHMYAAWMPDPPEVSHWTDRGYAVLAIDVRGQGGLTVDPVYYASGLPSYMPEKVDWLTGYFTMGILDPEDYFYRRLMLDCVAAARWVQASGEVDPACVGAAGFSQGGGVSLLLACAMSDLAFACAEAPCFCASPLCIETAQGGAYLELREFLRRHPDDRARVLRTLALHDFMTLSPLLSVPVLVGQGEQDRFCPAEGLRRALGALPQGKDVEPHFYPDAAHQRVPAQRDRMFGWLAERLGLNPGDG